MDSSQKKYLQRWWEDKIDLMFRFIQYIERQIVLFDAGRCRLPIVNNMEVEDHDIKKSSWGQKKGTCWFSEDFNVRTVLTAHPTQFYPGSVLGL
jgi:phosphoenolpyruvate carboxylase